MTVVLDGTGGLFTRLGAIIGIVNDFYTDQSADDSALIRSARTLAERTLIEQVNADVPLRERNSFYALQELIRQMTAAAESLTANSISLTPTPAGSNTGNGDVLATNLNPSGSAWQGFPSEDVRIECVYDGQAASDYSGSEQFRIKGEAIGARESREWPANSGSGVDVQIRASAASNYSRADRRGGNLTVNGDFELAATANTPNRWTADGGSFGSTLTLTATAFRGAAALAFNGDGATALGVKQRINSGTGTPAALLPLRTYALTAVVRHGGSAPAAGTLRLAVVDSGGSVLYTSSVSIAHGTLTGSYQRITAYFATPAAIAAECYVQAKFTAALENAKSVFVDEIQLLEMLQVGALGSYYIAIASGSTNWVRGDRITLAVANNWAGAFLEGFERLFAMSQMGLQLPTSGSPTISDSLVA